MRVLLLFFLTTSVVATFGFATEKQGDFLPENKPQTSAPNALSGSKKILISTKTSPSLSRKSLSYSSHKIVPSSHSQNEKAKRGKIYGLSDASQRQTQPPLTKPHSQRPMPPLAPKGFQQNPSPTPLIAEPRKKPASSFWSKNSLSDKNRLSSHKEKGSHNKKSITESPLPISQTKTPSLHRLRPRPRAFSKNSL